MAIKFKIEITKIETGSNPVKKNMLVKKTPTEIKGRPNSYKQDEETLFTEEYQAVEVAEAFKNETTVFACIKEELDLGAVVAAIYAEVKA